MERLKILVIDDTRIIGTALKVVFNEEGYDTDIACSGEEALEMARTKNYDLALIDLVMPGLDGVETCSNLKTLQPNIQCLLMTGHIDDQLQQKELDFIKAGGKVRNLYKPFSGEEVLKVISKILPQ